MTLKSGLYWGSLIGILFTAISTGVIAPQLYPQESQRISEVFLFSFGLIDVILIYVLAFKIMSLNTTEQGLIAGISASSTIVTILISVIT